MELAAEPEERDLGTGRRRQYLRVRVHGSRPCRRKGGFHAYEHGLRHQRQRRNGGDAGQAFVFTGVLPGAVRIANAAQNQCHGKQHKAGPKARLAAERHWFDYAVPQDGKQRKSRYHWR